MDWAALKAVYMAQPMTIANPATCSVRRSSVRRTCRILASSGETASRSKGLDLLDARNPLQGGDAFGDRRMRVEEPAEEAAVVLVRVVDHHRRDVVVETLRRPVVTVTDAWLGSRPVAKALGLASLMTYTLGSGRPSPIASACTMLWSCWYCRGSAGCAPIADSTVAEPK